MKRVFALISIIAVLFTACQEVQKEEKPSAPIIEKHVLNLDTDVMSPEVLWSFGRLSGVSVSPDNSKILYGVSYYSKEQNKGNRELFVMNIDGTEKLQLTTTSGGEYDAQWRPDGKKIGFLAVKNGALQLCEMNPDGSGVTQISDIEGGINGFKYAPDQSKILYAKEVKIFESTQDKHPDLPKSTGRLVDDLMYRHWDTWVDTYSHIFVADYDGKVLSNHVDIMKDEPYESPMKPFGGMEQVNFSSDSKTIAYTCRKLYGKAYSLSTNSDIYLYDITSGSTRNITEGMMGYDVAPLYSPDGSMIAWESMERDGYESDKNRLFIMDVESGSKTDYTEGFDQNVHGLAWTADSKSIYFVSDWHATDEIYRMDIADKSIHKITEGIHNYRSVIPVGDVLITTRVSMSKPSEIYSVDAATGKDTEISFENKDILDQLTMGKVESRWIPTTDGKEMKTWVIYPPHFDPNKEYPALLYCQGGPQGTVSQFWSYRWNFQMMAANGYIVVAPNRRGLPGFGQEWNEQISGDYSGQNIKDLLQAIDVMSEEPYIDKNRLGAVGASYGGYSVFYLAGIHEGRFSAFIAHDGMFNFEAQYLETEEMWFVNWDLGGAFWDKKNKTAQRSYKHSPHKFVQNWDTPILVIHGELDYRITYTQGMSAFNAAVLLDVPAQYLHFPDENHWVLKPQNGILWQRTFKDWLDKWLK